MMAPVVIDTNVLLVANGQHAEVSEECVLACIERLQHIRTNGCVVIDDAWHILNEYQHKTRAGTARGVGDQFLKWLLQNIGNPARVHQVRITPVAEGCFSEFPDAMLESCFDPSDRKFPAVANAHPDKPAILQAADCKWLHWWQALQRCGIAVEFLCPEDACHFYRHKFPDHAVPELPS